jgi:N-acetylmuramoyl-L-alanine amidase
MIPIFDNGHAGLVNGFYETAGKRSPNWDCGVFYEGAGNRWVVNRLMERCDREEIPYFNVSPELKDISLQERVKRVDDIYRKHTNTYLLSIHHNAGMPESGGSGIEGFTSVGETKSDEICDEFLKDLAEEFGNESTMRYDVSDGDLDKEANFYVLKYSDSPALLLELEFMDSKKGYYNCWDEKILERKVESLFKTIKRIYFKS